MYLKSHSEKLYENLKWAFSLRKANHEKSCPITLDALSRQIKKTGLQKKFIAKKSSLSPSQLSHIISGRRKAKPEVLKRIEKIILKQISNN